MSQHEGNNSGDNVPTLRVELVPEEPQASGKVRVVREPLLECAAEASQGAEGSLTVDWIKVPVRVRDDPRLEKLAARLGVTFREAVGLYVTMLAYCGDHETLDLPASVTGPEKEALKEVGLLGPEGLADYGEAVRSLADSRQKAREKKRDARTKGEPLGKSQKTKSRVLGTSRPSPSRSSLLLDPDLASDVVVDPDPSTSDSKTGSDSKALTTTRTLQAPKEKAWTSEAGDDWCEAYKGISPAYARIGQALGPLVVAQGWADVRKAWRRYLGQTEGRYASPERFAQTYGEWTGERKAEVTTDPVARSIERTLATSDPGGVGMSKFLSGWKRGKEL